MAPRNRRRALGPTGNPLDVHGARLDARGCDLATLVHRNAKALCQGLGVRCGLHPHLPAGICIADNQPCPWAPEGGSRRPAVASVAAPVAPAVVPPPEEPAAPEEPVVPDEPDL